jgi:hypothetical protein
MEYLLFFLVYTFFYAIFEVFLLEQVWKQKVKIMTWQMYWYLHPIPLALGVFLLSGNLFIAAAAYLLYGVLEDFIYNATARSLGSDVKYTDYMKTFLGYPVYYYINIVLVAIVLVVGHLMGLV